MYPFLRGQRSTFEMSYRELQKTAPASAERENLAEFLKYGTESAYYVEEFVRTHQTNIDDIDNEGETALMSSSYHGNIKLMKFLLQGGANPNIKCRGKSNTALHLACEYERYPPCRSSNMDVVYKRIVADDTRTLTLIKILIKGGAVMMVNKDGLNPVEVAALNMKAKSVFYCVEKSLITPVEQVRALEYLGTALGICGVHETAYRALHLAMTKRVELDIPWNEGHCHEMENFFGRPVSQSLEELEKIKDDLEAIRVEAFLVGEQVVPDHLRERHVYCKLAQNGLNEFGFKGGLKDAFHMLSGCLLFEKKGLLRLGCVLSHVMRGIDMFSYHLKEDEKDAQEMVGHICDILAAFSDVLREVDCDKIKPRIDEIMDNIASIILDVTDSCFSLKHVEEVFAPVTDILTTMQDIMHKATCSDGTATTFLNTYTQTSLCHIVIDKMVEWLCERDQQKESVPESNRFTRLIAQLLQVENALDVTLHSGEHMLHSIMYLVSCRPHLVKNIARLLVRHGCRADHTNHLGRTARCIAQKVLEGLPDKGQPLLEELDDLLDHVDGPQETLSLQELSARALYRYRIQYRAILPRPVWYIVEDRLDSILLKPEAFFH